MRRVPQSRTSAAYVLMLLTSVLPFLCISCEVQYTLAVLMQTQISLLRVLLHQRGREDHFGRLPRRTQFGLRCLQVAWMALLCSSNVMTGAGGVCKGTRSVRICVPGFRKYFSTEDYTSGGIREAVKTLAFHEIVSAPSYLLPAPSYT